MFLFFFSLSLFYIWAYPKMVGTLVMIFKSELL